MAVFSRAAAERAFPFLFIPVIVLLFHWPALSGNFILDDWDLLGPRVAQEFLAHPLSPFDSLMSTATPHYAPVARLAYAFLSLLSGTNPLPYHLVCLGLVMLAGVLLHRYLRILGVSPVPSLFAAAFFSVAVSHQQVPLWITLLNYTLLAVFLLSGLTQWEAWLRGEGGGKGRRRLVLTFVFLALALFTHSLGVLYPFLMALRAAFVERSPGARSWRERLWAVGWLAGATLLLQGIPRLFIPGGGGDSVINTDVLFLLKVLGDSFLDKTAAGFLGISSTAGPMPLTFPAYLLGGAVVLFLAAWFFHRRHWGLAATGFFLVLGGWFFPLVLIKSPEWVILRYRFHYIPDLGYAFLLAAIFDLPGEWLKTRVGGWLRLLPAALMALFLFQTWGDLPIERQGFLAQDEILAQIAASYVKNIERVFEKTPCRVVTIYDTLVHESLPPEIIVEIGRYDLAFTNHARIHRFTFGHRPEMMSRVRFLPMTPGGPEKAPWDECSFIAWGGDLWRPK